MITMIFGMHTDTACMDIRYANHHIICRRRDYETTAPRGAPDVQQKARRGSADGLMDTGYPGNQIMEGPMHMYMHIYVYECGRKKIRNSSQITLWRKWRLKLGGGVWVVCGCVGGSG